MKILLVLALVAVATSQIARFQFYQAQGCSSELYAESYYMATPGDCIPQEESGSFYYLCPSGAQTLEVAVCTDTKCSNCTVDKIATNNCANAAVNIKDCIGLAILILILILIVKF